MNKFLFIIAVIVIALAIAAYFMMTKGPDLSQYEPLREPRISKMAPQKMLVVEAKGDPNVIGAKAFKTLFGTYYKLKKSEKKWQVAPRARWPLPLDTPKDKWIGLYALPVSTTAQMPNGFKQTDPEIKVEIQTWEYGDVAEILHIGPYSAEVPTTERLQSYIKEKGYRVIGEHEEEYIKGPGMFGKGNPEKYYTIIRYRVEISR